MEGQKDKALKQKGLSRLQKDKGGLGWGVERQGDMWAERDRSGEEEADRDVACRASDAPSGMDFTVGLFPQCVCGGVT